MAQPLRNRPRRAQKDRDIVTVRAKPDDDQERLLASSHLQPTVQAGVTIRAYTKGKEGGGPDVDALISELRTQVESSANGDTERTESILVSQAHTLDVIFGYLARRAARNFGEYLNAAETYTRLALKAQAQCARTLEILGNLKNPASVAFVRQANIGNAVQVNNGAQPRAQEKNAIQSNELLRPKDGDPMERLPAKATGEANSTLAAVGVVNRAKNSAG